MKQGLRRPRRQIRASLTRQLARVRPARLDPDAPPPVSWPPASHFTQQPRMPAATSRPHEDTPPGRNTQPLRRESRGRPPRPPGHATLRRKLLTATSSAVAISAVLTLAVLAAGSHAGPPGRPAPSGHHRGTHPGDTLIRFQPLPLTPPWRGRVEYGIQDGVVYLTGFATRHPGTGSAITVLPQSIRPRSQLDIPIAATPAAVLTLQITPEGLVQTLAGPKALHPSRIWLSGVKYPLRS